MGWSLRRNRSFKTQTSWIHSEPIDCRKRNDFCQFRSTDSFSKPFNGNLARTKYCGSSNVHDYRGQIVVLWQNVREIRSYSHDYCCIPKLSRRYGNPHQRICQYNYQRRTSNAFVWLHSGSLLFVHQKMPITHFAQTRYRTKILDGVHGLRKIPSPHVPILGYGKKAYHWRWCQFWISHHENSLYWQWSQFGWWVNGSWRMNYFLFFVIKWDMKFTPLLFFLFCKKSLVQVTQNKVESNESTCNLTYLLSESEVFL